MMIGLGLLLMMLLMKSRRIMMASPVVKTNIFSESIPNILILLVPSRRSFAHTLAHVVIVSAVAALDLPFLTFMAVIFEVATCCWAVSFIIGG